MRSVRVVRSLRLAPLAAAFGLLAACAGTGGSKPPATVAALYIRLDQATQGYQAALQQIRAGNDAAGQQTLGQALDTLKSASVQCGSTAGCDPQRFFSAYDRMLRLKDGSFIGDESPDDEPQTGMALDQRGAAALPEAQRSVTLLHGQKLSELIAMNGAVKAALQMWLTQWRPNLIDAWINYQYLRSEMWPQYKNADLPEALLFGIMAKESGGKVHAVSRSGAAGPLQFMYATGMRFGLTNYNGFDLRFDPAASARANAEYMNEQLKVFNDNLELTLAAYNGGEGRMKRLVGPDTSVSFYDPRIYGQLSQETRDYVPSVLAAAWLFLHPDSYNLRFPKIDGVPGSITLKRAASLDELTVCLGSAGGMEEGWFRTLRNLNPRLDPQQEQPAGAVLQVPKLLEHSYASRCVDGPWPILAADLHNAAAPVVAAPPPPPPSPAKIRRYKVRHGDTLVGIVRQLRCSSVQELAEMNHLRHHHISVGQELKVPECR
ncbi:MULTISPECIES: transglycosylase SLT domain-containing protein [unclassified Rhodanobacter]|uniref:Transglycosylase SLT domain-containing protein n=1 Tax=Rhodanobacter humi TaxID=1888173 RepID=A0ABV4AUA7_9GAMM